MNTTRNPPATEQMCLTGPQDQPLTNELSVMQQWLNLADADILELGCGGAEKTRMIAEHYPSARIIAAEVDERAHAKNLTISDLSNVTFTAFGAEAIALPDASVDIVVMFKSLHHVPLDAMPTAFDEILRVLRVGGRLYISEPVFAGPFNEILRLFHDEQAVRAAAFEATVAAAATPHWQLAGEVFFENPLALKDFAQFERGVLNVTHTEHSLSDTLLQQVRERFETHASPDGYRFRIPNRVDVLEKI